MKTLKFQKGEKVYIPLYETMATILRAEEWDKCIPYYAELSDGRKFWFKENQLKKENN